MADLAISTAEKVIKVIATEAIKEICSMWGYRDELEQLNKTIITIKNVLLDADTKCDLSNVQQGYIAELKDAVYDADDLFDEFRTLVELNHITYDKGGNFFEKIRHFFSSSKHNLSQAYRMSRRVKNIKGHLDAIATNHKRFGFSVNYKPIVRRREDSCSYVVVKDIIGRDKDKHAILDMLLGTNGNGDDDDGGFRFLTIVGVGGLGKTALAQLVFNDEKIENEFSSSRLWVCVSDQDGMQFDVKEILSKILEEVTKTKPNNSSSMQSVQNQFQEHFRGKKYFLVLDDVWNEDRNDWVELKKFLMMGARGSRIVVTSRSEKTGNSLQSKNVYKLEVLSMETSQHLFEMISFEEGEKCPEKVIIGENIVRKCCGIPLAIKVIGSLLYGQDISKWQSIERSGLIDIDKGDNVRILHILKLSYYNLTPSLRSCFSYCAIFPKDFQIDKEMLIGLWMAHGFMEPLDGGQSVEDAAEEHFSILLRRCFFQDVESDAYGNIKSVKIHDLMHDVAQDIGKEEICVVSSKVNKLEDKIRHLCIDDERTELSVRRSKIRSYICNGCEGLSLDKGKEKFTALRVLVLCNLWDVSFPQTLDRLLLLRYLNFHNNWSLEVLPSSITRLYNLQTLILRDCRNLRKVPKDFSNLTNLVNLDLYGCLNLNEMPLGILKLSNLRVLPYFVASNDISDEELKVLQQVFAKLKGKIDIMILDEVNDMGRCLTKLETEKSQWVIDEGVLEKLVLPTYLKELVLSSYNGKTMPWPTISLPHYLIRIEITFCGNLEQIPVLSRLPYLKSLKLVELDSVEYMEGEMSQSNNDVKEVVELFPSLEYLYIRYMSELKGWRKGDFSEMRFTFPRLSYLQIRDCPKLALNIICPTLETLVLKEASERLLITGGSPQGGFEFLRKIKTRQMDLLNLLSVSHSCLTSLESMADRGVQSALECLQDCASSLKSLYICHCNNLRKLRRLDHFIALEYLALIGNDELSICEEDDEEEPCKSMPPSLHRLSFLSLPKMKSLPKGIQHLTSLQSLCLSNCPGIKSLPESFKDLTSLKELQIRDCPDLEKRCKKPNGEDFPKIKHIPRIDVGFYSYFNK